MQKKLNYELREKFEVALKGESVEVDSIEMSAPTNQIVDYVTILDNEFNKAIFQMSQMEVKEESRQENDVETEISSQSILMALSGAKTDLRKCHDALKNILIKTAWVKNGETRIKFESGMYNKMSYNDTKNLLGEYLKFFLSISLSN